MIYLLILVISIYVFLMIFFWMGFKKAPKSNENSSVEKLSFSIVIPFRNEADNLPILLKSIEKLNYPIENFEVILVDDESIEKFQVSSFKFQVQMIANQRQSTSPKKDAIQTAILHSKFDWIITTDADCIVPENWLLDLNNYILNTKKQLVCGSVFFKNKANFLNDFQQIEMISLQAATIGSFDFNLAFMCNGANFAYSKSFFHQLNGFEGNEKIASGDDVFLLQKAVKNFPDEVGFLLKQDFQIITNPAENWSELFQQRVRWAGKSKAYTASFGKLVALIVFLGNLAFILSLILLFFGVFEMIVLLLLKVISDLLLANQTAQFYKIKMKNSLLTALVYPFFSSAVAFYSLFGKYEWKGRSFKS
ncbi:MAG: glycosyl transferase [Bacteroidetes bacterium HGW-Bacteroidetes-23]|nr:MAG: glycosyl transferase [Bacteroidetes bacterium HGW-Bacteroidetes-23]